MLLRDDKLQIWFIGCIASHKTARAEPVLMTTTNLRTFVFTFSRR